MSRLTERAENPLRRRVEKAHCVSKGGLRLPKPKQSPPSVSQPGPRVSKPTGRDDNTQRTPLTLPKPEILPSKGTPTLSNAHNDHPNTHRDTHPANANTHPTNNLPVNDHRWNDHPVKTTRKLGRRPHARRIAGGEGGQAAPSRRCRRRRIAAGEWHLNRAAPDEEPPTPRTAAG